MTQKDIPRFCEKFRLFLATILKNLLKVSKKKIFNTGHLTFDVLYSKNLRVNLKVKY